MSKILKNHLLKFPSHGKLRFSSTSTAISFADSIPTTSHTPEFNEESSHKQNRTSSGSYISLFSDPKFCVSTLFSCKELSQVREVHAQVALNGILQNLIVVNKLIYIYAQFKSLSSAYALFHGMTTRDAFSWSVMIGGFAKEGDVSNCFKTFRDLIRCGLTPDNYTLPFVIRVCRDKRDIVMGSLFHGIVLKFGLDLDHYVCAALADMYAKCKRIEDARKLFDEMTFRDRVTWTVMIGGYGECGNANESLVLFDRMKEEGIVPDKIAMVAVVFACAKFGAMHKAILVHDYINKKMFSLDVILGTAMIDMYSKCGSVDLARQVFDMMGEKNVISWSAMIAAYGYHGEGRKAVDLFNMMLSNKIFPNRVTFVSLLYACSHSGLVEEGLQVLRSMQDEYGVRPDVKHYTCTVDLLGRAGRLEEAERLIENMKVEKDEGVYGALLAACRIHKNMELAEKAAKSLLELQPQNPGNYILLSNIYANAGRWEDMAKMRELMSQRRLKKVAGYTWIEVDNKTYQFSVGDRTHPRSNEIHGMLKNLIKKLELGGYVPDTTFVLHDVDEEIKLGLLSTHSEKLAIAFGLIATPDGECLRITKNLRVCGDCHTFCKFVSTVTNRVIVVRDANRFHHFKEGHCSCDNYW